MHYVNSGIYASQRRAKTRLAGLVLLLLLIACKKPPPATADAPAGQHMLDISFDDFYDAILMRTRTTSDRATDWNRNYVGSWVRWRGKIVTFTDHSVTLRCSARTSTFDASLGLTSAQLADAQSRVHKNQWIAFMGKLDSYDDLFRTVYLVQGVVLDNADAGVFNKDADLAWAPLILDLKSQPSDLGLAK